MYLMQRRLLLFVFIAALITGCSVEPEYRAFDKDGAHLEIPAQWTLSHDAESNRKASRVLLFNTGELSYFSLNFLSREDVKRLNVVDLKSYAEFYHGSMPTLVSDEYIHVNRSNIDQAGYAGIKYVVETLIVNETVREELLFFDLGRSKEQTVYAVFNSDQDDVEEVSHHVAHVLESIRLK